MAVHELDADVEARLICAARDVWARAYAPYSKFKVGSAVLAAMPSGAEIFAGCNVENASFGLTICAERNAVFQAVASGARSIIAVAVVTDAPVPTMPCGACRQVLREFGPDMVVVGATLGGLIRHYRLSHLLPDSFGPEDLPAN
jgi:cytidine deaminase